MARILEDGSEIPEKKKHRDESFSDTYPDYMSWLDGNTWELRHHEDMKDADVNGFRASLYYQASLYGLKLRTKTKVRRDEKRDYLVLLVRAYSDPKKIRIPYPAT